MSSGFISETDIVKKKKAREEEWQKTRKENDPLEPPEEPIIADSRSLYERLQEQKQKKQDEWEEAHKLKNMVRGLEDDEVDFLALVDHTKQKEEQRVKAEEKTALEEFRKKVSEMQQKSAEQDIRNEILVSESRNRRKSDSSSSKKPSQLSLLTGAVKRKSSEGSEVKSDSEELMSQSEAKKPCVAVTNGPGLQCVAVIPGLGVYTDSSNSDSSDTDSDLVAPVHKKTYQDLTGREVKIVTASYEGRAETH